MIALIGRKIFKEKEKEFSTLRGVGPSGHPNTYTGLIEARGRVGGSFEKNKK